MGMYLVKGVSRLTGERMDVRVDARHCEEARDTAARNGVVATAVAAIGSGPPRGGSPRGGRARAVRERVK